MFPHAGIAINIVSVLGTETGDNALHPRHHRLAYTGIVCGVLLIIGLIALNFPVFLDAYDQWGFQIKCGTGYVSDLTQAASDPVLDAQHNYVDKCETAAAAAPTVDRSAGRRLRAVRACGDRRVRGHLGPRIDRAAPRYGLIDLRQGITQLWLYSFNCTV